MSKSLAAILLGLLFAGCVPCWNPLFTEGDLTSDPALVGTWGEAEGKDTWTFSKADENKYKLVQVDGDGQKAEFDAHLVKLKDRRFLDLLLVNAPDAKINGFASASLLPGHLILQVYDIGLDLRISAMNPDWLNDYLKEHPKVIEHRKLGDDRVVLTASTKELQQFVLAHAEGEGLFGTPDPLKRRNN